MVTVFVAEPADREGQRCGAGTEDMERDGPDAETDEKDVSRKRTGAHIHTSTYHNISMA